MPMPSHRSLLRLAGATLLLAPLTLSGAALAQQQEDAEVSFATPPWPGVIVKTAMVSALLEALDYQPSQREIGVAIAYEGLHQGEVDAFLAAWLPSQKNMYDAAMPKGTITDLGNNIDGARLGLTVPRYVAEAGVTSIEDLDKPEYAERFDRTIYSIETGSGVGEIVTKAIAEDTYGLGDWEISETSTPGMLSVVNNAVNENEWVVFNGWRPHWMNVEYDIVYLEDPKNMWGPNSGRSEVHTLINKNFAETHANAKKLLDQIVITSKDQSQMIKGFSYEEREPEAVAEEWIKNNPDKIEAFAEGVTTRDGKPAWPALKEAFDL